MEGALVTGPLHCDKGKSLHDAEAAPGIYVQSLWNLGPRLTNGRDSRDARGLLLRGNGLRHLPALLGQLIGS